MADVRRLAKQAAVAVYAGAAAALPIAVAHHWLSAGDAQDIGVTVAAVAAGWHSGLTVADRHPKQGSEAVAAPPRPPAASLPAAAADYSGDLAAALLDGTAPTWRP